MKMINDDLSASLGPGTIHIWLIEIDEQHPGVLTWEKFLSPEEIERSRQYRFELDRLRFVTRRGILRQLLRRYTGIAPEDIQYLTNPHGKLALALHPLHFSVSHSQDRIAYAFSIRQDIGVDIEQVKPLPDLAQLAKTSFSLEECTGIISVNPSEQLESFYHIWTQKEAFIKANGEGLTYPLRDFSVSVDPHNPGRLLSTKNGDPSQWQMVSYVPEPGWRVATCFRSKKSLEVKQYKTTMQGLSLEKILEDIPIISKT